MASFNRLSTFVNIIERVYGSISTAEPEKWSPPLLPGVHRGRQLWTDAIGVINLLTIHHEVTTAKPSVGNPNSKNILIINPDSKNILVLNPDSKNILILAQRLVEAVHDTLGYTRDGTSRLPGATDEEPLKGGLRAGNIDEEGLYKDGQYHHQLTLWMFALNRMTMASNDPKYNDMAVCLAKAVHVHFFNYDEGELRMVWKVSTDLTEVLIDTEGDLDPGIGWVVYGILQATHARFQAERKVVSKVVLEDEVEDHQIVLGRKRGFMRPAEDPMELGMTLWTAQWLFEHEEVQKVMSMNVHCLTSMHFEDKYFSGKVERRDAFRELTACMGIACVIGSQSSICKEADDALRECHKAIIATWHKKLESALIAENVRPVTNLMYAAALVPGAFRAGFFGPEPISDISDDDNVTTLHQGEIEDPVPSPSIHRARKRAQTI